MSAWVLPDYFADVLPAQARHIEHLRRTVLDVAHRYGYEMVIPPLVEHLESLLTGTGEALNLQTFKLVDQISGRSLGLRADTTPQVARIDAHLLNRAGVARLCYCGPVVHTKPAKAHATREPLQFGAEIYGHADLQAELEVLELALQALQALGLNQAVVDLGDVRVVRALTQDCDLDEAALTALHTALALKDVAEVAAIARPLGAGTRQALLALPHLWGGAEVLDEAQKRLPASPLLNQALADLKWLLQHLQGQTVRLDLAELRGYAYYSGVRFALYCEGLGDALVRGGRYDQVGAVFGRKRPAVGFSLDLKELATLVTLPRERSAIRAPWSEDAGLRAAITALRVRGETVICVLPQASQVLQDIEAWHCDRELRQVGTQWVVQALPFK